MLIREAVEDDLAGILKVLKASLGETSSQKTADVWNYKHRDNPFGKSLVLVAEENGELIGVRAFMRWDWMLGAKVYRAFRAVDTATHPEHQGKGVFKKLTLEALKLAEKKGFHFIFNTPNEQSKPGYLKMGWQEVGKLRVILSPRISLKYGSNSVKIINDAINIDSQQLQSFQNELELKKELFTPKDLTYLRWRYIKNPLQDYFIRSSKNSFLACYIKARGRFQELRISEAIWQNNIGREEIRKNIGYLQDQLKPHFVSLSDFAKYPLLLKISGNYGPVLTHKVLNLSPNEAMYQHHLNNWSYSLGDLELF